MFYLPLILFMLIHIFSPQIIMMFRKYPGIRGETLDSSQERSSFMSHIQRRSIQTMKEQRAIQARV
jgi:hypothetical protein